MVQAEREMRERERECEREEGGVGFYKILCYHAP
jgi:hypothetical protein